METIKELNTQELEQVNGGFSFCAGIGISFGGEANACLTTGASSADDGHSGVGVTACYFVGVGGGLVIEDSVCG